MCVLGRVESRGVGGRRLAAADSEWRVVGGPARGVDRLEGAGGHGGNEANQKTPALSKVGTYWLQPSHPVAGQACCCASGKARNPCFHLRCSFSMLATLKHFRKHCVCT